MRFLFVASGRSAPSTRFRILQFVPLLEAAGHRCDVAFSLPEKYDYFPWLGWRLSQKLKRGVRRWHALLARVRRYDAILIEREVFDDGTSDLEETFRTVTKRLVLDVDDGVFLRHPEKFERIARICDVAIAGNQDLREYLEPRCRQVEVIPTCIRMSHYPPRIQGNAPDKRLTIGWIGTTHNVAFLDVAAAALRRLTPRHAFRLLIVATTDERLKDVDLTGVDLEFRPWDPAREVDDIREMDLGLMPLPAGEDWMKYKCGLKLLQYLAVGIPAVASPIGVNEEILRGQRVGRAAMTDAEWEAAIAELLTDEALRRRLGEAGRQLVTEQFSVEANWEKLEGILAGTPSTARRHGSCGG